MNFLNISKRISYSILFFLPFFFVPNSILSPVMNQKAFILSLVLLAFISFAIAIFRDKEVKINNGLAGRLVLGFLISASVSLLVSGQIFQGYWGYAMQSDSLFCFVLFSSLFFLFCNAFNQKDREKGYAIFSFGSLILGAIYLFQIFLGSKLKWQMVLPGNEESAIIFSLGLIFTINYIFKNFSFRRNKKHLIGLIFASIFSVVFTAMLYLMGIKLGWFLSAIGAFFIFWKGMQKRNFNFNYPEPFISFLLTIFFLANFLLPLNDLPILKPFAYSEPTITYSQSFDIIKKSLNTPQKIFFGTGPTSFPYNFSLNKGTSFSAIDEIPTHPNSAFFMIVNNFGILGMVFLLSILALFIWKAVRFMLKDGDDDGSNLLFVSAVCMLFIAFFFYRFSILITSFLFIFLGLLFSVGRKIDLSNIRKGLLKTFFVAFSLILVLNLYFFAQYIAEKNFQNFMLISGEESSFKQKFGEEQSLDKSIELLEASTKFFNNADYDIYLSKAYLSQAIYYNDEYFYAEEDEAEGKSKELLETYAKKAEEYAKSAVADNPKNFFGWENLGMLYEDLEKIDSSKKGEAIKAYKKAQELAPFNYELYVLQGRKLEKDGNKKEALVMYKRGLELKPDFVKLEDVIRSLESEK